MRFFLLLLLLALGCGPARGQGENNNWLFGHQLGVAFTPGGPVFRTSSFAQYSESASTISDAQGRLLFYTNGVTIWDRDGQPMTNACATCDNSVSVLSGHTSAAQGVLIVPQPGSRSRYYVFTTDARENDLDNGLRYTEVDLSLRGGLGGVTAVRNVRLPTPTLTSKVMEGVAGLQHANRRDVWVVVHSQGSSEFLSFLVTAAGVAATPVVSPGGSLGIGPYSGLNKLKFSPDGGHLARAQVISSLVELFDFDAATGRAGNRQELQPPGSGYGTLDLDFSADAGKLYEVRVLPTPQPAAVLAQYNLRAGSLAASRNSAQVLGSLPLYASLEIGPDGRLYASPLPNLGVVDWPNRLGTAAGFRAQGVVYGTGSPYGTGIVPLAMQNIVRPQPPVLDFMAETACAGQVVRFEPYDRSGPGPFTWIFYDPATGRTDSLPGPVATRTYPLPGTYSVTLSTVRGGQYYRQQRTLLIAPVPAADLPDTLLLCQGATTLAVPLPTPGGWVRWVDGSTAPTRTITEAGTYTVTVHNYLGCERTATTTAIACLIPNVITPNGDQLNETLRLVGARAADWRLEVYNRWGRQVWRQESYDNAWSAQHQTAGIYYYLLTHRSTGHRLRGYVEVIR